MNHVIWKKCPKPDFVKREAVYAVCSPVIEFSDEKGGIGKVTE